MSQHTVNGTLFTFPDEAAPSKGREVILQERGLNGRNGAKWLQLTEDETAEAYERHKDSVLSKAEKARGKHKIWPDRIRPPKAPKPGSGGFSPESGAPGANVTVERDGGETIEGQIQFPAPRRGTVWVSLWDGKRPIMVQLDQSKNQGCEVSS